jgi:hypothetical protein
VIFDVIVRDASDLPDAPLLFDFRYGPSPHGPGDPFQSTEPRRVEELKELLRSGDGPLWLGATQATIDGAKMAIVRPAPAPEIVRAVWNLLPTSNRNDFTFASFAFSAELNFDLAVYPATPPGRFLTEDKCRDYPEGRYELALQSAIESGDQAELDRLLARRSSQDVLRMALFVVLLALVVAFFLKFV